VSLVALCTPAGSSGSTTATLLAAAMAPPRAGAIAAECDPSGGDVASWAQLRAEPGWATAVAASDRTWPGLAGHVQSLPSRLGVLLAPSRAGEARTVIETAAIAFAPMLAALPERLVFADCGRVTDAAPMWAVRAQLTLLLVRQSSQSAPATVAIVDRALEAVDLLRTACPRVGVVLVGATPYPVREIEAALGIPLFATLPDDRAGAAVVCGAWAPGRRIGATPLATSAAALAARVVEALPATMVAPPADPALVSPLASEALP